MRLRPLHVTLALASITAPALRAQSPAATQATPTAANTTAEMAKPTETEIAWWLQVQKELAELRAANFKANLQRGVLTAKPDVISAATARLEQFLDRRDKDPVGDLGPDFKDYRERLLKLCETALTPLTAAAKFNSSIVANGEERMMRSFKIIQDITALDEHKPKLAQIHEKLDRRIVAAGGQNRFFFQVFGLGDKAREAGASASPEERDAQFLKDAQAIGPVFADLAKGHFIDLRVKHGLAGGAWTALIETVDKFRTTFADAPTNQLQMALQTAAGLQEKAGSFVLKRHIARLDIMRRTDVVAHSIAMQEFQGAYQRWIGKVDEVAPIGLCRDIAVAHDGSWFAYGLAEKTLVIREAGTGKVRTTVALDDALRALAPRKDGTLLLFTAAGIFQIDPKATAPKPELKATRKSAFLEGRMATARHADICVYALGVMPAVARGEKETTFSVAQAASRITAVAVDDVGEAYAYGYAGDNITGMGKPRYGVDILAFPKEDTVAEGTKLDSKFINAPMSIGALSIDLSSDSKRAAVAWYGKYGGAVTLDEVSEKDPKQTIFSIDGEAYTWVQLVEGTAPRVVAGTRQGVVRVWDATSRDLIARFNVTAGPSGVAYGMIGEELISVALGQAGIHRWKLTDGALLASYDGEAPKPDAAALTAERELYPARETLIAIMKAKDNDARLPLIDKVRGEQAKMLEALGQRESIENWYAGIRARQIRTLVKEKRAREGFELGYKEVSAGILDSYLVYITLYAGNGVIGAGPDPEFRKRLLAFGERAAELYPTDVDVQREYRDARAIFFAEQNKVAEAMKEIDQLDLVEPGEAPHSRLRYSVLMFAYDHAKKANRNHDARRHLIAAMDHTNDKKDLLILAENVFSLAYGARDWKAASQYAAMVLNIEPNKKNDTTFINAARYAYGQANPQQATPQQKKK